MLKTKRMKSRKGKGQEERVASYRFLTTLAHFSHLVYLAHLFDKGCI